MQCKYIIIGFRFPLPGLRLLEWPACEFLLPPWLCLATASIGNLCARSDLPSLSACPSSMISSCVTWDDTSGIGAAFSKNILLVNSFL